MTKRSNAVYDVFKITLSLMVVGIHTSLFPKVLYPWLRLAVPLFFVMSSYFLFSKLDKVQKSEQKNVVKNYVKRNCSLYLFWLIVLLPVIISMRKWFLDGQIMESILNFVKGLLFGSTFVASWYISASVIAMLIVFFASKHLSSFQLLIASFVVYATVCLRSSYMFLLDRNSWFAVVSEHYDNALNVSYNSFPVAVFWFSVGKCFAENKFKWSALTNIIVLAASMAGLYVEWFAVKHFSGEIKNDCYFMLIPTVIALFHYVKNRPPVCNDKAVMLRKMSTIIFVTHASVAFVVSHFFKRLMGLWNGLALYIATVSVCLMICLLIFALEKTKLFKWLKYSY